MSFNFNDLNVQLLPEMQQYCPPLTIGGGCLCQTRPQPSIACGCLTIGLTNHCRAFTCQCLSIAVSVGCGPTFHCGPANTFGCGLTCQCVSHPRSIICICNTLPIASYPIHWNEFEEIRNQLNETLKQVDIQQKAAVPQTEANFEAQAADLKRQLDAVEKQREDFRKSTGGGNAPAGKK